MTEPQGQAEPSGAARPPATEPEPDAPVRAGAGAYLARVRTIRDLPSSLERALYGAAGIGMLLLIWHVLTLGPAEKRFVDPYTLPSIRETVASFPSLWVDRALARGAFWSLARVLGGFLLSAALAVPLGVLAGCYLRLHAFLRPLSIFGRNVPIAALIPLTLIWFGLGETQKIMFIFLASGAFIFFDTTNAVHAVSDRFLDTAYTLGARRDPRQGMLRALGIGAAYGVVLGGTYALLSTSPEGPIFAARPDFWFASLAGLGLGFAVWFPLQGHQAIRKVVLPLALPDIVNSLRLLFGLAFGYIMLAEVINARHGLGSIIIMSQRRGPREHIYLSLIIIALLAFLIDRVVLALQHRWFPYRQER